METFDHGQISLSVHDVKNQSINERKCAVLARCVNSIFIENSRNAIPKQFQISLLHMNISSISTFIPELYRECCADFIKCNMGHLK